MANLSVLCPETSACARLVLAWKLFYNFSWAHAEGLAALYADSPVGWEIRGIKTFEKIRQSPDGAILLIAHMGSYDVAASLFADKFNRPVNTVRVPELLPETQEYLDSLRRGALRESYAIHYNKTDAILAAKLLRILAFGEIVALQGDRVVEDVSPILIPFSSDWIWRLPRGPLTLAHISSCPAYPILVRRSGYRRYVVEIFPPVSSIVPERSRVEQVGHRGRSSRKDRAALPLVYAWAEVLYRFVRAYPSQWFVFERAFIPRTEETEEVTISGLSESKLPPNSSNPISEDRSTTTPRTFHGGVLHRILRMPCTCPNHSLPDVELVPAARAGTGLEAAASALWVVAGIFLTVYSLDFKYAICWATIGLPLIAFIWIHLFGVPLVLLAGVACKLTRRSLPQSKKIVAAFHQVFLAIVTLSAACPSLFPWIALWLGVGLAAFLIDISQTRAF